MKYGKKFGYRESRSGVNVKDLPEDLKKEYYQTAPLIIEAYHKGMRTLMKNYEESTKELWESRLKAERLLVEQLFDRASENK